MEVLSKSTQKLIQEKGVREAVHTLLDQGDRVGLGPVSLTVTSDGKQVELTRIHPTESDLLTG